MWEKNKNTNYRFRISSNKSEQRTHLNARAIRRGFTLIELLIAIAIVGIIAAASLPMYFSYVQQGRVSDSVNMLSVLASRMESEYLDRRHYASPDDNTICAIADIDDINKFNYTCELRAGDPRTYEWKAASSDGKYVYLLNETGVRTTATFPGLSTATANCWHHSEKAGHCF